MYKTIDVYDFIRGLERYDFSREGAAALYNYLIDLEEDMEQEIEFDPVALNCEWTEYSSFEEIQEDYPDVKYINDLEDMTPVIPLNEGFIIENF